LKQYVEEKGISDQIFVSIVSGANINFHRLRHISERAELGERREVIFAATIPEKPGSFRAFCEAIGDHAVTEFNYRYAGPGEAHVFVGIQLDGGAEERALLLSQLKKCGYPCFDMSDNEMAKLHARHLVGGRAKELIGERMLRFEFPERPGALRNHGAAVGRVLVGMQVPGGQEQAFDRFLDELHYPYIDETENPAYKLFLS
jgi:threonine dehydratase